MFTKVCIIANILQFEPIENIEPYLEDLDENNCDNCKQKVIIYAAKHKYMKALDYLNFVQYDYLLNSYYHCIQESINYAAANGHVDVLEWFHNSIFDFEYNSDTIDNAAANGHVNVLEWFKNSNYEFIYNNAISYAAQFEHLKCTGMVP